MSSFVLLLIAVASHVLPHPWWSFTAVGGVLLLWGAREPLRSFPLPMAVMACADWYLTTKVYGYPFHVGAYLVTWAWYGLALLLGRALLRERAGWSRTVASAALSSTSFFLASNYAVWASIGSWYPHTGAGLMACFAAGLPFYRNDFLSTLLVVSAVLALSAARWARIREVGRIECRSPDL